MVRKSTQPSDSSSSPSDSARASSVPAIAAGRVERARPSRRPSAFRPPRRRQRGRGRLRLRLPGGRRRRRPSARGRQRRPPARERDKHQAAHSRDRSPLRARSSPRQREDPNAQVALDLDQLAAGHDACPLTERSSGSPGARFRSMTWPTLRPTTSSAVMGTRPSSTEICRGMSFSSSPPSALPFHLVSPSSDLRGWSIPRRRRLGRRRLALCGRLLRGLSSSVGPPGGGGSPS